MVFHLSFSDSKSPQVSRIHLKILAVLSNAVICIVSTPTVLDQTWLGGKGDSLGIVQEIETRPYYQMIYAHTRISFWVWDS